MKQILLAITFLFSVALTFAQTKETNGCSNCYGSGNTANNYNYYQDNSSNSSTIDLKVFPNPATEFIGLSDNDEVGQITVFNLVGKRMKTFQYSKGETYNVSDLPGGMYLVQLSNKANGKIITTQRLTKR